MASDLMNQERTRRGLLAAAVAASVAAVAASVARINPVRAADGDAVTVGSENVGDNVTSFETTDTYALAGTSDSSRGVNGVSNTGQGVHGTSTESAGVAGVSDSGNGVHGTSTSNRGIWGESTSGVGVEGHGATGIKAESAGGFALHTSSGRARFDGISGIVVIPANKTEVNIETAVPVTDNTFVLISPQANLGDKGLWYTIPEGSGQIVVHISKSRPKDSRISYLILEHAPAE